MHLKFKHEITDTGQHRIVETISNTIGDLAGYNSPAFLKIDNRIFSALTDYYSGVDRSYPPIETVFEMLTHETEHEITTVEYKGKLITSHLNENVIETKTSILNKEDFLGLPTFNEKIGNVSKSKRARKEKGEVNTLEGWARNIMGKDYPGNKE